MQTGPYIHDRLMPRIIADYCRQAGMGYKSFSDDWVQKLTRKGVTYWVVGYRFDVNGAAAADLAQDKVATFVALDDAGINAIPHYLVRVLSEETVYGEGLRQALKGAPIVVKPLDGMGGRNVRRLDELDAVITMINTSGEHAWALSPYVELKAEYRLIMLDGELLLAFEKTQPSLRDGIKLFNLGNGALAVDIDEKVLRQLLPIAEQVMRTTTLRLAAVDIVRQKDGELRVLEVNCGISLEHYGRQSPEFEARAVRVYTAIIEAMFR